MHLVLASGHAMAALAVGTAFLAMPLSAGGRHPCIIVDGNGGVLISPNNDTNP